MKKIIFIAIFFIIVHYTFIIEDCTGQWEHCISFNLGTVYSIEKHDSNIFAGVYSYPVNTSGVYVSSDNGITWAQTSFNKETATALAIQGNIIYAGASRFGISYSTDNGMYWIQTSLDSEFVTCLAASENKVFCGTYYNSVFYSSDYGYSWIQTPSLGWNPESLAINGNYVYVGAWGLYKSSNNGTNWEKTSLPNNLVTALAVPDSNNIYAGVSMGGIFYSSNGGETWNQNISLGDVNSIVINGIYIYAGSNLGVYLSSNNGLTWFRKGLGGIQTLLVKDNYLYAGTFGGVIWRRLLSDIINVQNISTDIPPTYSLSQNYPNPFNAVTKIQFKVASEKFVKLVVFDLAGREVAKLVHEELKAGVYEVRFDSGDLPSGIYFYRMETEKFTETKKLILLK